MYGGAVRGIVLKLSSVIRHNPSSAFLVKESVHKDI